MAITSNVFKTKINNPDINGGTIDNATIATSDITVESGKTLNVSAGTLTLADNQISGDKVEGGTINAVTVNTLTSTTVNATTIDTNVAAAGITLVGTTLSADGTDTDIDINITPKGTGEVNLTKVDIDAGTIDGVTIGETTPNTIRGYPKRITKTETGVLSLAECSGTIINNYGQTADMTLTFPGAADQINCKFEVVTTGFAVYLKAGATDKYEHDGVWTDDADKIGIALPAVGDCVYVEGMRTGETTYDLRSTSGIGAWADSGA